MASFFLIIYKKDNEETASFLKGSLEDYGAPYSWIFVSNNMGIAMESSRANSQNADARNEMKRDCFFVDDKSGCIVVSDSRIDYRRELAGKLGHEWNIVKGFSDSQLILNAYLKWGQACLSHLYGDFSFVVWDPLRDELLCARDHFGCRPLYYVDQTGFMAVATQIAAFKNLPGFRFEIREQYILDAICSMEITETHSAYKGISKLKPAHYLKQNSGQLSDQNRYWDLKINEPYCKLTLEEASAELRDRIFKAVRQRSHTSGHIGVELSGGLDSSGIASVLTMLSSHPEKIHAFTHTVSPDDPAQQRFQNSEMEFCEALIEKYNSIIHFKITGENSEGGYKALIETITCLQKPINLHYAMNSDLLFEMAGNVGTSLICSGFGGDEGITNNGSGYFNELIKQGQHSKLRDNVKRIACRRGRSFYRQLIKLYINYYVPWVFNLYTKDWRKVRYRSFAIQKNLARKYGMKHRFFYRNSPPSRPDLRAIQYFRLMYPSISERIEETSLLAQQYGIEYSYPFLDVKLIEFFYSLPSEYKFNNGMGRYLFRLAMEGILPEKIRMRTYKGGNTIPNVFARTLKDEEIFREIIEEGRLKNQYHYVDYDKLHAMLDAFKNTGELKRSNYGLRAFQSAMSVLILQKWQREGKVDIGIKC